MRRLLLTLLLASAPLLTQTRDDKWRQDLQYLAAALPKTHPNLFAQMTQADFTQAISQLNDAIPSKADYEIIVEMAREAMPIVRRSVTAHSGSRRPLRIT